MEPETSPHLVEVVEAEAYLSHPVPCRHCGSPVPASILVTAATPFTSTASTLGSDSGEAGFFCCRGCEAVFQILKDRALTGYYDLKRKDRPLRPSLPVSDVVENFAYLDEEDFRALYADDLSMNFYLEGVHCSACVWLTEKVADWVQGVRSVRLNLGASVATVRISESGSFAEVAREFQKLGYRPHPVKQGEQELLRDRENRMLLIRLGIAGACSGNIMLLLISLYAGAEGELALRFRWISLALFLPVLFFSAVPFYRSAWGALRSIQASIDIPVAFGILFGASVSFLNLLHGSDQIYFDSLSTLVFLLLCTRYLLRKTQQSALNNTNLMHFLTPSVVRRRAPGPNSTRTVYQDVPLAQIRTGDLIEVLPGENIPVDGMISRGRSEVSPALLTGEATPNSVGPGDQVFAGTVNLSAPLEVLVTESGRNTRLGNIIRSMEEGLRKKASIVTFSDRISQGFVLATLGVSAALFIWGFQGDWHEGFNRALAVVIVLCPCAFALATPLALSVTLGRLAECGILVKGAEVLEKLCRLDSVFLDKTGTLTFGMPEVLEWKFTQDQPGAQGPGQNINEIKAAVLALEQQSSHVIAKALVRNLLPSPGFSPASENHSVEDFSETIGQGVQGTFRGKKYEIRSSRHPMNKELNEGSEGPIIEALAHTEISVFQDDRLVARVSLGDRIRPDSGFSVSALKSLGIAPWILSGDHREAVWSVARQIGILPQHCQAEASPEMKGRIVESHPRCLMVGDGANDSIALASAFVGISVHGGVEVSMRAADVYLTPHGAIQGAVSGGAPGVSSVYRLIVIARETLRVIHRNFGLSIIYNVIAGTAAICGQINPLLAAVLMPISALVLFVSSILGTARMKATFQELCL